MDPKRNPYAPGAGTQPPELAGRDTILADAEVALARIRHGRAERGLLLTGLRGVGKTVLLNRIRSLAEAEGYFTDLIEAPEDRSLASLLIPSLRQTLVRISVSAKMREVADRALRILKSFAVTMSSEGELKLNYNSEVGVADSGDIERDLQDVMIAVGEAAKANDTAVAILIDEIQYLNGSDLAALIVASHRIAQRGLPVAIMGAGLPLLPALSGNAKSYAERLFRYPKIGPLNPADAKKALQDPAADLGVSFNTDALDDIVTTTAGYPYFIQEWGYVVWRIANNSPITKADVEAASVESIRRLDESFFRVRLERVTDAERKYLRAMAGLDEGPQKTGSVARMAGKRNSSLGPVRDSLIKKGMIYSPRHGAIEYTVPLFGQFMLREMPDLQ